MQVFPTRSASSSSRPSSTPSSRTASPSSPMDTTKSKGLKIVLVEDDDGHAILIQRSLRPLRPDNQIVRVSNGQQAVDYLFHEHEDVEPTVVFLDLNLPILDGYQVLARLKGDQKTRKIPVVVISTTDDSREMERCYELGANAYISKPLEFKTFSHTMKSLGQFLSVVSIPAT